MKKEFVLYVCRHCGNVVVKIKDSGVPIVCCGEDMMLLNAQTENEGSEKHIPVVTTDGINKTVTVGSVLHPMSEEHYISWIVLVTDFGFEIKYLDHNKDAVATFMTDEEVKEVYSYCNIHGLWKVVL